MGKIAKKLVVYLDQNFISEMAKAEIKTSVNPQFTSIYELLHEGFVDEKIVVPSSIFHELETSLSTQFKDRIREYQGYLGQLSLRPKEHVYGHQLGRAAYEFLGKANEDLDYHIVFSENPNKRAMMYSIHVDMGWDDSNYREERQDMALLLSQAKDIVKNEKRTFQTQVERELYAQKEFFLKKRYFMVSHIFQEDTDKVKAFVDSQYFSSIPCIDIDIRLWSHILVRHNQRPISKGDYTDTEIISAYLPYMDVLATDRFMAQQVRDLGLDRDYGTTVFDASKQGLKDFELFLKRYLSVTQPINSPQSSIFVLSDEKIKKDSWKFFQTLCYQAKVNIEANKWVDVYAFDDGHMPRYELPEINNSAPFYGLQFVEPIPISNTQQADLLKICRERCKSKSFILLDHYIDLKINLVEQLIKATDAGKDEVLDIKIHNT